jgi:hypothetical protein
MLDVVCVASLCGDGAAREAAGAVPALHGAAQGARKDPPAPADVDGHALALGDGDDRGIAAESTNRRRGEHRSALYVTPPVRVVTGQGAHINVHEHREGVGVGEQRGAVLGEGVFADSHERICAPSRPRFIRRVGNLRSVGPRAAALHVLAGRDVVGLVRPQCGLDRRLHERTLLWEQQRAQTEHAVVLEVRPHPAPAQLVIRVARRVEVQHPAAGAADPGELRP